MSIDKLFQIWLLQVNEMGRGKHRVTSTQQTSQDRENWGFFCASRLEYLSILGEVVEQGFIRRDTEHPTFCGCIDWHSSVHGAYALLTAARLTGQSRWAEVVDAAFTPECLDAELDFIQAREDLDHELPYGYAWFLKLAKEREQQWGKSDLLPLATGNCLAVRTMDYFSFR